MVVKSLQEGEWLASVVGEAGARGGPWLAVV